MLKTLVALFALLAGGALAQQVTTLAQIEKDPAAYAGREVVLVGYTWSWFSKTRPAVCENVPPARGNVMRTRSDGYVCDGTRVAWLPPGRDVTVLVSPADYAGALQLVVQVRLGPEGWWLELRAVR